MRRWRNWHNSSKLSRSVEVRRTAWANCVRSTTGSPGALRGLPRRSLHGLHLSRLRDLRHLHPDLSRISVLVVMAPLLLLDENLYLILLIERISLMCCMKRGREGIGGKLGCGSSSASYPNIFGKWRRFGNWVASCM